MRTKILGLLLVLHVGVAYGATPVTEAWRVLLPGDIDSYEITELGELLVITSEGLHAVDNRTGLVEWTRSEFSSEVDPTLEPIAGSPFYRIVAHETMYILDPVSGRVLFDSLSAGVEAVEEVYFLYDTDNILVKGRSNRQAEAVVVLVDMRSAKAVWRGKLELGKVLSVDSIGSDRILIVTLFDIFNVDRRSGEVIWQVPTMADLQMTGNERLNQFMKRFAEEVFREDAVAVDAVLSDRGDVIYLGAGAVTDARATYMALDSRTGKRRWTTELSGNYPGFQTLRPDGVLVMPLYYSRDTYVFRGNRVNLLDYRKGEGQWGKKGRGLDIKGGVTHVYPIEEGLLLSAWNGDESFLYQLDPAKGEFTEKKPAELDSYVTAIYETDAGVLCFTRDEINLLNLDKGKLEWRKGIRSTPELTAMRGKWIYAYDTDERRVMAIDTSSGDVDELTRKSIKFRGRESPTSVELIDEGILVSSSQNMALFTRKGDLVYQRHYPAPRREAWVRALYYAQGIRAAIISAQSYYVTGAMIGASLTPEYREADVGTRSIVTGIAGAYGEQAQAAQSVAAESFRRANERFKATAITRDSQIILSEISNRVQLLKVAKRNGEIEASLDLGEDKEPDYSVDPVTEQVYLKVGDKALASYRL